MVFSRARSLGARGVRRAGRILWPESFRRIPVPPARFQRFLVALVVLSIAGAVGEWLLYATGNDRSEEAWSIPEVTSSVQNRLTAIATTLDSARNWLAADPTITAALAGPNTAELFALLSQRNREFAARLPDSTLYSDASAQGSVANRGFAVYSADGKLLAWNTPVAATFGFDTVLSEAMRLPSHDRGVLLENGPIYADLISIQKLVSKDGLPIAYIAAKQQLATKEPLANSPATNFIEDIPSLAGRAVSVRFGERPGAAHPDNAWVREGLLASPSDPQSFVGTLSISRAPQIVASPEFRFLHGLWEFALSLALFSLLLWLLVTIAEVPAGPRPNAAGLAYSILVVASLFLVRIGLILLGASAKLFGSQYQDQAAFSFAGMFGIAANPLELFITSVFTTAVAVMLWIIWMPRERLIRDESGERNGEKKRREPPIVLLGQAVASAITVQLLIDGLSTVIEALVRDGSLRYLSIEQVLPAPSTLMMLLAFLGIGVTYLFLAALTITFGIRAAIELTSRYLHVWRRITLGSLLTILFLTGAVVLFDQFAFSDTSLLYRAALTALTFLVSLPVIIIDASVPDPLDHGPSFLYRLPRSSRSILFILGASAVIMSPLIATKQLVGDEKVARRVVLENAEVDTPELTNTARQLLATAGKHLREWQMGGHDTSALRDEAFLIWMGGMRQHPAWNAAIDVYNSNGVRESHFATLGAVSELDRVRPALDSELLDLRRSDSSAPAIHLIPSFTSSGAPAIIGGLLLHDTTSAVVKVLASQKPALPKPSTVQTNVTARPLFVTISLWSELPALVTTRANIPLLPGSNGVATNPEASSHFIVAQYRPNLRRLTNSPSLDVPASIPPGIQRQLLAHRSLWETTSIGGIHYQTLYYRATAKPKPGEIPTVVTVSVSEPSYASTLEFALRLNAIGLLYGALIVIVLLLVRQVATRRVRFTLHFRDRIFLIVLVIALVPLVVVTNVTRSLLAERAQVEEQDRLTRDAAVIKDRMTQSIENAGTSLANGGLQSQVDYLSQVIGRDFSVYDATGRLKASSRPELYESSFLSSTLNSTAVREVIFGARAFFTEPVQIGAQAYDVGYQPVMSANGSRLLAVLALATMDEQPRIEAEIARTTSFIYGTFAALGLVLLGIGALFAARVASPILELIRATERIAQGKLQTSIPVTREDEIGDLMHAFNTMTRELERSREIVAQTERELAWKEMARQVAHEIKNPLTPMKLSVQHLEHAHEAKDPNFNTIFRRVIRTMREQIDVLTRIATEFAHFGAMPRRRWGAVDIRTVADSAVALFDAERSRIRFIIDVPKNLPRVHSDEEELRRAFVNLLRNSVQAIDGWGVIVIRARSDQGMVHIQVRDTGFGMQEETLKKVFDPNFSTKTSGMGLGLAIVKKTITDMAGTIRVESQPGQGTTFFIDLPARADLGEEG